MICVLARVTFGYFGRFALTVFLLLRHDAFFLKASCLKSKKVAISFGNMGVQIIAKQLSLFVMQGITK
jgi:hypothetical protein